MLLQSILLALLLLLGQLTQLTNYDYSHLQYDISLHRIGNLWLYKYFCAS